MPGAASHTYRDSEHPDDGVPLANQARLDDLGDVEGILVEDALNVGLALGVDKKQCAGDFADEGLDRMILINSFVLCVFNSHS